jgi:hypothetical protein
MAEINPCNCSTCDKRYTGHCPLQKEYGKFLHNPNWIGHGGEPMNLVELTITICGCLSHPLARATVNEDTIGNLEQDLLPTDKLAVDVVIGLLREGVEQE